MLVQNNKISEEHEKIIEQFKYLLPLDPNIVKQQLVNLLNRLQPFLQFPLDNPPPIQFFQMEQWKPKLITEDLKNELKSYCFLVLRGSLIISKQNYEFTEQKYLDQQNIRQKSVYNFDQGKQKMRGSFNCVYLKIHNIWIKKAKKKYQDRQRQYIKSKLISIGFFSLLTFQQFNQCCAKSYIKKLGPQQILIRQGQLPYHMYVVAEGQICLEKRVKFSKQLDVWNQVKSEIVKNNDFCQELFQYLIRQPKQNEASFEVQYNLKQLHQGEIFGAKQTLLQQPLQYTIRSTLKTKLICIKYPDLYVLNEDRLMQIRHWPYLFEINKKQLRKQYYSWLNWGEFKEFLRGQSKLCQIQKSTFDAYLRKNVDLNSKRYNFCSKKVNQGKLIQSPAGQVLKLNDLSFQIGKSNFK